MPNNTSQVQHEKVSPKTTRYYPGEAEGRYLTRRLNQLSPEREPFLFMSLWTLLKVARVGRDRDIPILGILRKEKEIFSENEARTYLFSTAAGGFGKRSKLEIHGVHEDGLIIGPETTEGKDALTILSLEAKGKLDRIKRCIHCQDWFYARFKHQQFCSNPEEKCQFNHYHSSEWRKRNRERNRRHQVDYRKRNPGRRR